MSVEERVVQVISALDPTQRSTVHPFDIFNSAVADCKEKDIPVERRNALLFLIRQMLNEEYSPLLFALENTLKGDSYE